MARIDDVDVLFSPRHEVTSLVYQKWVKNENCSCEIALAIHFFDGTYNMLESYIIEGAQELLLSKGNEEEETFDTFSANSLTYDSFAAEYMHKNRVLLVTDLIEDWEACKEWCKLEKTTTNNHNLIDVLVPDLTVLKSRYGDSPVEVDPDDESVSYNKTRIHIPLSEFSLKNKGYVKDFHFRSSYPEEAKRLIPTPFLFIDDWLNEYANEVKQDKEYSLDSCSDYNNNVLNLASDYHFMYMGGKGTSTHLHADVLGSYSWSANVCGKKTWRFLHPKYTYLMRDVFGRKIAPHFDIENDDDDNANNDDNDKGKLWQFPLLSLAPHFKIVQEEKEVLFVPSEWYHTVLNERDTLSINANWFNRHNLKFILKRLRRMELSIENEKTSLKIEHFNNEINNNSFIDEPCIIEEEEKILSDSSQQYGKPPFDLDDFLNLLEWKISKSTTYILDIKAIYEVSLSLSQDVLFRSDHRTRAKHISEDCVGLSLLNS